MEIKYIIFNSQLSLSLFKFFVYFVKIYIENNFFIKKVMLRIKILTRIKDSKIDTWYIIKRKMHIVIQK